MVLPSAAGDSLAGVAARSGAAPNAADHVDFARATVTSPGPATNLPSYTIGEFSLAPSSSIPGNLHLAGARA